MSDHSTETVGDNDGLVDLESMYLIHDTSYMQVKVEDGSAVIACKEFAENSPIYSLSFLQPVVSDRSNVTGKLRPLARNIVVDIVTNDEGFVGPVAVSVENSNKVDFGPSAAGAKYRGDFGKRLQYINDTLKSCGGIYSYTKGRWGLNCSELPKDARLVIRFGPFAPPDGLYVMKFKQWRLLELKPNNQWEMIPSAGSHNADSDENDTVAEVDI